MRVEYEAPASCPDQAAFETIFLKELDRATLAQAGELARALAIRVTESANGFQAGVELVDREGQHVARVIQAPTCAQAVETIALVAALAARSQAEQSDRREADAEARAVAAAAAPSALPSPTEPAPTKAPDAPVAPASLARRSPPHRAPNDTLGPFDMALSAGLLATSGVGPAAAFGGLFEARLATAGAPSRSLALLASYADTLRNTVDGVDVRLRLLRVRLELCPLEPRLSKHVSVSPCAGFELGSQTGEAFEDGARVFNTERQSRLWAAATLAGRARLRWGKAGVALGPELVFPFTRNEFLLERPKLPLHEVPVAAVGASASAGIVW